MLSSRMPSSICWLLHASAISFSVGCVVLEHRVNTKIAARLSQTNISIALQNEDENCTDTCTLTIHLPRGARISGLYMDFSENCSMEGEVLEHAKAKELFESMASSGSGAALLSATAWDTVHYQLHVALPPLAQAQVELRYEELLQARMGKVDIQLPFSPGLPALQVVAEVTVHEPGSGVGSLTMVGSLPADCALSREEAVATDDPEKLAISSTRELAEGLPAMLRASYKPGLLPEEGLLLAGEDNCIVHLFNPPSLSETAAMLKRIIFVIDVSGSMSGTKLRDAKAAFSALMKVLDAEDIIEVHSFSDEGVEGHWGPLPASASNVENAVAFVNGLKTIGGTNLRDAYIMGLKRLGRGDGGSAVPVLIMLTDGQASSGVTRREDIASDVFEANADIGAKIFALAFGYGADLPLLMAIAIENDGVAVPIYEGFGDAAEQIEDFLRASLGRVLLTDLAVHFEVPTGAIAVTTVREFPVLAAGSELALHARLQPPAGSRLRRRLALSSGILKASTRAKGPSGQLQWSAELDLSAPPALHGQECSHGYAYGRISEKMNLLKAAEALVSARLVARAHEYLEANVTAGKLVEQARREALELALESGIVWPGLTSMVTRPTPACDALFSSNDEDSDVCSADDGDNELGEQQDAMGYGATLEAASTVSDRGVSWFVGVLLVFVSLV